jgi:serine protease AprX
VIACPLCSRRTTPAALQEARWLDVRVLDRLAGAHPRWRRADGACPACVQQALLETLLIDGRQALEGRVQSVWPLDAAAAFGALPTTLRVRADPRFTGRGTTIALVDAGFFPHPDLVRPDNRVVAWVDASQADVHERYFSSDDIPSWPCSLDSGQWHGLMTSVTAAGNGWLSHGLYRGMAPDSRVVLVQVSSSGHITNEAIARALTWLRGNASPLGLSVVSLSVGGDLPGAGQKAVIDEAIADLVAAGIVVVAAAGNDGRRSVVPPATSADAITVGGLDDHNVIDAGAWELWHSNYGPAPDRTAKPEVVAPSIWTVAPVLPGSAVALEARRLFAARAMPACPDAERRIAELRLVTPHYQHVEGTSFATPIVASLVACMREANPALPPKRIKELLMLSATRVAGAADERQGAGVVDAGLAVAAALADAEAAPLIEITPLIRCDVVRFTFHDHAARSVQILGSWNDWKDSLHTDRVLDGTWQASLPRPRAGRYSYKFLVDDAIWLPDPSNPFRTVDDDGNVNSVFVAS